MTIRDVAEQLHDLEGKKPLLMWKIHDYLWNCATPDIDRLRALLFLSKAGRSNYKDLMEEKIFVRLLDNYRSTLFDDSEWLINSEMLLEWPVREESAYAYMEKRIRGMLDDAQTEFDEVLYTIGNLNDQHHKALTNKLEELEKCKREVEQYTSDLENILVQKSNIGS